MAQASGHGRPAPCRECTASDRTMPVPGDHRRTFLIDERLAHADSDQWGMDSMPYDLAVPARIAGRAGARRSLLAALAVLTILVALPTAALGQADAAKPAINSGDTAWLLASAALVMLMTPGLALF